MKRERGSVLVQVLLTAVVASLMCAAVLRARFQPALTAEAGVERVSGGLAAQGAVNRVTEVWSRLGTCSSDAVSGVSCVGSGCSCRCAVEPRLPGGAAVNVESSPSESACALSAAAQ